MKVVIICHLFDELLEKHISFKYCWFEKLLMKFLGKPCIPGHHSSWNTNMIESFKKVSDEHEFHFIIPLSNIDRPLVEFNENGIYFHCIRNEIGVLIHGIVQKYGINYSFKENRKIYKALIHKIEPQIVHVIGAENPYYSLSLLDVEKPIMTIVSLQTLMSEEGFCDKYPIDRSAYKVRSNIEKRVIAKADFIATEVQHFRDIILHQIKPDARFLDVSLFMGASTGISTNTRTSTNKTYDIIYFAKNIMKSADVVARVFNVCCKIKPLKLCIVGAYSRADEKHILSLVDDSYHQNILFAGYQQTHDDVMNFLLRSKIALLPLKVDMVTTTIREAMFRGIPVVTSITPLTPGLNKNRMSVLISENEEIEDMSKNVLRLLEDNDYYATIRNNAYLTVSESYNNDETLKFLLNAYSQIID